MIVSLTDNERYLVLDGLRYIGRTFAELEDDAKTIIDRLSAPDSGWPVGPYDPDRAHDEGERLGRLWREYAEESEHEGTEASVDDFAAYLAAREQV